MIHIFKRSGLAMALAAGAALSAQSVTTGAVAGKVVNASGEPIAGATISLTSGQATFSSLSAADGTFRRGLLNPGIWSFTVTKPGFTTSKGKIEVGVNDTRQVNFKLVPESTSIQVDVVATNAAVGTEGGTLGLTQGLDGIQAVPKGRNISQLAFLAPGVVDDGGFGNPSIAGASGAENKYYLDGLQTTDFRTGFQGMSLPTEFIDQVNVQTGALTPEYSALGGVFTAVSRQGTNEFKGEFFGYNSSRGLAAKPRSNEPFFKAADPSTTYDYGFTLGGPLVKDKVFFFAGVDSSPANNPGTTNLYPGLASSANDTTNIKPFLKLNWFVTPDHQLSASYFGGRFTSKQPHLRPTLGDAEFGRTNHNDSDLFTLNYDWTINSALFLSAKYGHSKLSSGSAPTDVADLNVTDNHYFRTGSGTVPNGPGSALTDFAGLAYITGGTGTYTGITENVTTQTALTLNWFPLNHSVKVGVSHLKSLYTLQTPTSGPGYTLAVSGSGRTLTQTFFKDDATVESRYLALFAQDFWEFNPGMKLGYGARWEAQQQYDGQGNRILSFNTAKNSLQPYLGFTWDVNRDGKSKVSATYRTSFEAIPQRLAMRVFGGETFFLYNYRANYAYDGTNPNHWGSLINGATLATGPGQGSAAVGADAGVNDFSTPFSYDPIAKDLRLPRRQEVVLGYDHQVNNQNTVGIHARHRWLDNPIEDSVITDRYGTPYDFGAPTNPSDPTTAGGQAILWNPGKSVTWTANKYSTTPGTYSVDDTNFSKAYNRYTSVDLTWDFKSGRFTSSLNYTWSRLYGNYEGVVSSSNLQADGNITASFDYYPYVGEGYLPLDRTHALKWFGNLTLPVGPHQAHIGWNASVQSGTPISLFDDGSSTNGHAPGYDDANTTTDANGHTVVDNGNGTFSPFWDLGRYGAAVPDHFKLGNHGRTPTSYNVDLHFDVQFTLGRYQLTPGLDVFNATNSQKANLINQQAVSDNQGTPNPAYGQAVGFQPGRSARVSLKLTF